MEQPNCYKIYFHKNIEILTIFKTLELICHICDQNIQFPHISNDFFKNSLINLKSEIESCYSETDVKIKQYCLFPLGCG